MAYLKIIMIIKKTNLPLSITAVQCQNNGCFVGYHYCGKKEILSFPNTRIKIAVDKITNENIHYNLVILLIISFIIILRNSQYINLKISYILW